MVGGVIVEVELSSPPLSQEAKDNVIGASRVSVVVLRLYLFIIFVDMNQQNTELLTKHKINVLHSINTQTSLT